MTRKTSPTSPPVSTRRGAKRPPAARPSPPPADPRNEANVDDDGNLLESLGRAVASPVLESEPPQGGAPGAGTPGRKTERGPGRDR